MSRFFSAFGTAFVAIGFICAPLGALATFIVYVLIAPTKGEVLPSIVVGLGLSVVIAVTLSVIYAKRYQKAADVNAMECRDIQARLQSANNLVRSCPQPDGNSNPLVRAAWDTANKLIAQLTALLDRTDSTWLAAEGYLEAWTDVYAIEESMILFVPVHQVVTMANDDRSRLHSSQIPNQEDLTRRLNWDVGLLSPPHVDVETGKDELSARVDIASVRKEINRYRREQWSGLVAERNRTLLAAAFAGLLGYFGLVSVIVWNIDPKALMVAMSFVVIGALVALLHQLTSVGSGDFGVEDFGQSTARLLSATFLSGLIALVGVIVLEGASLTINGAPLLQSPAHWKDTFDWTQNKSAFFFAALFGVAPSLLFTLLQSRADDIKKNLDSSQATGGRAPKA
jgi:hypothetical protein